MIMLAPEAQQPLRPLTGHVNLSHIPYASQERQGKDAFKLQQS